MSGSNKYLFLLLKGPLCLAGDYIHFPSFSTCWSFIPIVSLLINTNLSAMGTRREKRRGFISPFCFIYKFLESLIVFVSCRPCLKHWKSCCKTFTVQFRQGGDGGDKKIKNKQNATIHKNAVCCIRTVIGGQSPQTWWEFGEKFVLCHIGFLCPPPSSTLKLAHCRHIL